MTGTRNQRLYLLQLQPRSRGAVRGLMLAEGRCHHQEEEEEEEEEEEGMEAVAYCFRSS